MRHNDKDKYPLKKEPTLSDFLFGSDSADGDKSINIELSAIVKLIGESQQDSETFSSLRYRFSNTDDFETVSGNVNTISNVSAIDDITGFKFNIEDQEEVDLTELFEIIKANKDRVTLKITEPNNHNFVAIFTVSNVNKVTSGSETVGYLVEVSPHIQKEGLSLTNGSFYNLGVNYRGSESGSSTTVEDSLTSTSTTNALSANQGKVLSEGKLDKNVGSGTGKRQLMVSETGVVTTESAPFSDQQEQRLRDSVYVNGTQSLTSNVGSAEKGVSTNITYSWNVVLNDDVLVSATLDGNNVTSDADGTTSNYSRNGILNSLTISLATVVTRSGSNVTLNTNRTVPFYVPQYSGAISTSEPSDYEYATLAGFTKYIQSSHTITVNVALNNQYLFFLSNDANASITDLNTNFSLSVGDWSSTTAFFIKKQVTMKLADGSDQSIWIYRVRELQNQTLNVRIQ